MTRKDFLFLAAALKKARPAMPWTGLRSHVYGGWEDAVRAVAYELSEQTRKFDVPLFLRNAGVVLRSAEEERFTEATTKAALAVQGERR